MLLRYRNNFKIVILTHFLSLLMQDAKARQSVNSVGQFPMVVILEITNTNRLEFFSSPVTSEGKLTMHKNGHPHKYQFFLMNNLETLCIPYCTEYVMFKHKLPFHIRAKFSSYSSIQVAFKSSYVNNFKSYSVFTCPSPRGCLF